MEQRLERRAPARSCSTTGPTCSTRRVLLMPLVEVHRADRPALALDARRDRPRARLRHARLPLRPRGVARRADGRARARSRSARSGTSRRSRAPAGSTRRGSRSRRCSPTPTTSGSTAEEIGADRRAARQLPAGVHAPRADQRGREPRPPARRLARWPRPFRTRPRDCPRVVAERDGCGREVTQSFRSGPVDPRARRSSYPRKRRRRRRRAVPALDLQRRVGDGERHRGRHRPDDEGLRRIHAVAPGQGGCSGGTRSRRPGRPRACASSTASAGHRRPVRGDQGAVRRLLPGRGREPRRRDRVRPAKFPGAAHGTVEVRPSCRCESVHRRERVTSGGVVEQLFRRESGRAVATLIRHAR